MTRGEFERLKSRFGEDVEAWPAPFRAEGLIFLGRVSGTERGEDAMLDRLVLEASLRPTDESHLARKVLSRIGRHPERRVFGLLPDLRTGSPRQAAAGLALALAVCSAGGYFAAGVRTDRSDAFLLALAVGAPPAELADTIAEAEAEGDKP